MSSSWGALRISAEECSIITQMMISVCDSSARICQYDVALSQDYQLEAARYRNMMSSISAIDTIWICKEPYNHPEVNEWKTFIVVVRHGELIFKELIRSTLSAFD